MKNDLPVYFKNNNISFEDLIEERHKRWIDGLGMGGHAKQFSKLVAVQKEDL